MFCLMDVSGSMTEHMKDLAKRFYVLLYIFLKRRYKNVDVVFIRHTHQASEVDEETFFNSPETGGTVVSTALEEMQRVSRTLQPRQLEHLRRAGVGWRQHRQRQRQDRGAADQGILPCCQYYAYLEVGRDSEHFPPGFIRRDSDLWQTYSSIIRNGAPMAMRKVGHRRDIYPVFRELFAKKTGAEAARRMSPH